MCAETGHLEHVPEDTRRRVTRDSVPFCLTIKVMQFPNVRTKQALHLCQRQRGQQLSSVQIMLDFPKDPGSSLSCTAYHQGISPCIVEHSSGFKRVSNVAIRDNRNGNFLLNCPNTVVLSVSVKQTGAGASVNSQSLNATLFGQLGNLYAVTVFRFPNRCES
ncbi:Uncharacterised protein [Klebsiella pneumoniae]|uniref:Uncharacterized protein n=1 Tax=Klebsiella pneumoniae TaxID=573 RepID=A0A447RSV7_KLEPN|nr:Uncharacterised protein [Klebsiella pneumoniae]